VSVAARRGLLAVASAFLLVRLLGLPAWGTFDVEVQKAWAARAAAHGLADIYGPSDRELLRLAEERGLTPLAALLTLPVPRTRFEWGSASYFVDYPPGSLLLLLGAGRLYALVDPELRNRRLFNAAINLAPLLGSLAIAWLLWRSSPREHRGARLLAFWLNPAVVLAAPFLGYQDSVFGAFALGAVIALMGQRHALAWALTIAAGLVKPQGALLLPALVACTLREASPRVLARAAAAALGTAAVVLAPWWSQGHLWSALDGCRRPLTQTTLAPLGLNVWWVAGWAMDAGRSGLTTLARIVPISEFQGWAGFDPRLPARALLLAATLAGVFLLLRAPRADRRAIPLAVVLQVHAYALLGTSVHENHTFLAVVVAPLLLGALREAKPLVAASSGFLFASLFFAAGFGRRVTRQAQIAELRSLSVVDASVLVALLHVALVAWLLVIAARTRAGAAATGTYTPVRP
jgi:Gpi18-like mannosyltransferase